MVRILSGLLLLLASSGIARAYIDVSPTLGSILHDSTSITVLEVDKVSQEKRAILFKKIVQLKGKEEAPAKHLVTDGFHPREPRAVMDWAEPGKTAIAFASDKVALICTGGYWYECAARGDGWWTMTTGRPELSLAFFGPAEKLRAAVADILAGKEVVITAVGHGAKFGVFQYHNVAYQKVLRGKDCPIERFRASLKMPTKVWQMGEKDSAWVVGVGAAGAEDIPVLVKSLTDADSKARSRAADDLGLIGVKARVALPQLRKALDDDDPIVRISAARALGLIGETNSGLLQTILKELKNETVSVRRAAALALADLETDSRTAVEALRDLMQDAESTVRWSAIEALDRIGAHAEAAVGDLALALRDPQLREIAADALGSIGPASRGAIPLLLDALKDTDVEFRWTAAVALSRIDTRAARAAVPLFIEKLQSHDHRARWDAMLFCTAMGRDAKAAAPAVREIVKRGNGVAAQTLAAVAGPDGIDALGVLLHVLADDWDTSESIAQIGPAAVPELIQLLADPKKQNVNAHLVLKTLGLLVSQTDKALPPLIEALDHFNPKLRRVAAQVLGGQAQAINETQAALERRLADDDPLVRVAAAETLSRARGDVARTALQELADLVSHSDRVVRREAALALGRSGEAQRPPVEELTRALKDKDEGVRLAAAWALARVNAADGIRLALGAIKTGLGSSDPAVRRDAAHLLGQLGTTPTVDVVNALGQARLDDDDEVRRAAGEVFARLRRITVTKGAIRQTP